MATVVLKLFAGQGTRMDGQTDRWTKLRLYASPFKEHNNTLSHHFESYLEFPQEGWT